MQPTVLVIDDDRMIRQILEDMLTDAGFNVILASGGDEGCRIAIEFLPDVVLVDLVMPDRDGLSVCSGLRKQPGLNHVPIILMTAYRDMEKLVNPFQVGADDYVSKPFDRCELIARIKGNLQKKQLLKSKDCKARHYDALLEISEAVYSSTDAGTALKEIVRKISQHLDDVDRCSIALIREHEDCGYVVATTADLLRPSFRIDLMNYPEIRQVMTSGRPLLIDDVSHNPLMVDFLPAFEGRNISAIMVFPVIHSQRVVGAMIVRIAHPGEGEVSSEDVAFCKLVSNVVVAALKGSNFFDLIWEEAESLRNAKHHLERDLKVKELYEQIFENASEGLIAFMASGQVVYANRCMLEMVGIDRAELNDASLTALFGGEVLQRLADCSGQKKHGSANGCRFDIPFTSRSGQARVFSVSISREAAHDELRVAAFRDVTDKRRIEEDLLQTKANLEAANAGLVKADRARADFLNTAVHELRTPVTIVSGYCSLLAETDKVQLTSEQRSYVEEALEASDRLADLVNNLLDLSRLESGSMALDLQPHDLVATAREFLHDYESLLRKGQLQLDIHFPDRCTALFDEEKIYRVLVNLLANAAKFTPRGGKITIRLEETDNAVLFTIEDTGKGIPAEGMDGLFEEFSQVGKQDSRKGSGLGLYICRKIIESHHGRIWAESQPGQGSRFSFSLPKSF
ncbi:ATP-binding protein [Trichloromonas sp.]|uniref:hybrid sensor histidine kinase/response regulator n=1 Tax=Trichloromonas sp. TaxID=3069249 RepID=UPI003D81AE3D